MLDVRLSSGQARLEVEGTLVGNLNEDTEQVSKVTNTWSEDRQDKQDSPS